MITHGLYKITSKINGKTYIGESFNIEKRKARHFSELRCGIHKNIYLQRHVNKYGIDDLIHEVIEIMPRDKEILSEREKHWIKTLRSNEYRYGFNLNKGGLGGAGTTIKHKNFILVRIFDGKPFVFKTIEDFEEKTGLCGKRIYDILNNKRKTRNGWTTKKWYKVLHKRQILKIAEIERKKNFVRIPPPFIKKFSIKNTMTGKKVTSINIKKFCSEHDLNYQCMLRLIQGRRKKHKEWIIA